MNIFVLDNCPRRAAQMQCDKHVVKMALTKLRQSILDTQTKKFLHSYV